MADDFDKELKATFLEEVRQLLEEAEQSFLRLEKAGEEPEVLESLYRLAHNIKGSSRAAGFAQFQEISHRLETVFSALRRGEITVGEGLTNLLLACHDRLDYMARELKTSPDTVFDNADLIARLESCLKAPVEPERAAPPPFEPVTPPLEGRPRRGGVSRREETLRVPLGKLDRLFNNVGELVVLKTVLSHEKEKISSGAVRRTVGELERTIRRVQEISMGLRLISVESTFLKLRRVVRDVSQALCKEVELELVGAETEVDKLVLEQVADPLVHLVRNAIDHGVESAGERKALGKSAAGKVRLSAFHQGEHVILECRDDGRGLDARKLMAKAVECGALAPGKSLTDQQAYQLIFLPGFSTSREVTEVSGRGVGMDVVKTGVARLGGRIEIESSTGEGTCFRMILPFTVAIVNALVVGCSAERYIIPLSYVHQTLQPRREQMNRVGESGELLRLHGDVLPIFPLGALLGRKPSGKKAWESVAIVLKRGGSSPFVCVTVDDIFNQQQVVMKRLGLELESLPGVIGGAILGDGRPSIVLDPLKVIEAFESCRSA